MSRAPRSAPILALASALGLALAPVACERPERASAQPTRCALCGMRVDRNSLWRAGLVDAAAVERIFDTPKCLLRFRLGEGGRGARDAWMIEYYSGERRPAEDLYYVIGSDVRGPMGRDAVPIEGRERAERFREDHHGERVLAWREIDAAIVDSLFRP
jgi:hypothetical protein